MNPLILFYLGSHPDHQGRYLSEILDQDDYWLEVTHDYIQWIFPTREFSRITPNAPTITKEVETEFLHDELLRDHLKASFYRILLFYGLEYSSGQIEKASSWNKRKANWFTQDTHNNLRLTRVLKCLSTLGMKKDADNLYACLLKLRTDNDCGIGQTAFNYWLNAVNDSSV